MRFKRHFLVDERLDPLYRPEDIFRTIDVSPNIFTDVINENSNNSESNSPASSYIPVFVEIKIIDKDSFKIPSFVYNNMKEIESQISESIHKTNYVFLGVNSGSRRGSYLRMMNVFLGKDTDVGIFKWDISAKTSFYVGNGILLDENMNIIMYISYNTKINEYKSFEITGLELIVSKNISELSTTLKRNIFEDLIPNFVSRHVGIYTPMMNHNIISSNVYFDDIDILLFPKKPEVFEFNDEINSNILYYLNEEIKYMNSKNEAKKDGDKEVIQESIKEEEEVDHPF